MTDKVEAKKVLGIVTQYENKTVDELFFLKNNNFDKDGSTADEGISVDFDFDFQQRVIIYEYVKFRDAIITLGALLSALKWVFGLASPFLIWYFLLLVARTIQENHSRAYRDGLNALMAKSMA